MRKREEIESEEGVTTDLLTKVVTKEKLRFCSVSIGLQVC